MNDHDNLNEYQALVKREFAPYSNGHRLMYDIPILMLKNSDCQVRYDILDIGVGIGYGLEQMLRARVIKEYIGFEPCKETYDFMWPKAEMHLDDCKVQIFNDSWPVTKGAVCGADYSFAIEVIEHVPLVEHRRFIWELKESTLKTVFLSTPDACKSEHGVREKADWRRLLKEIFGDVVVIDTQWTDLYICQR